MIQKMIVFTLILDIVLVLCAFIILFFDKKNSAYFLSRNLKSFFAGRKSKTRIIKTALFFLDFIMYSVLYITLISLYNLHYFSPAILILLGLTIIIIGISFPFYFLKTVAWAKKRT
ncbi:MAG: hypothetical protein WCR42_06310 [bacterium]